jgi:2,3-bisphosphoglycerate-independent phosphoglycerate mutase
MQQGPHALIILDGFGYRHAHDHNAVYEGHPEHFLRWLTQYPSATLKASGVHVGLLPHMIGNSEVGHLTIGSGRVTKQPVAIFSDSIHDGTFFKNSLLIERFRKLARSKKKLHLMGLLSDAGVHSHIDHLLALIKMARMEGITSIVVHPFLDGRDVPPQSAARYLKMLENELKSVKNGIIGTMHGRFYAMDRDVHWERIERSYKILTTRQRAQFSTWEQALSASYDQKVTDEFFVPIALHNDAYIQPDDAVIFFNFRADRARELTRALIDKAFTGFPTQPLHLDWMITFTKYHPDFQVDVLLEKKVLNDTFFDVLETAQKHIFTIAETEKYAHVTYFFNGGREVIHQNETRILIPSKRHYATYALIPEMSALEITNAVLQALRENHHDFYLINYANADMVGHSGDFLATCKAVKCLDTQLEKLYERIVKQLNGTLYITADHGKAEEMYDIASHQPRTAHTINKVPFLYINQKEANNGSELPLEELADIAPFILKKLALPIPTQMKQ